MLVPEKRIADFEKLGFGMFVHWGLYSQKGKGEWTYWHHKDEPMSEYKKLQNTFTAEDFNAEEMVLAAKRAGCKYITLTTRHHEGFSLYDTCGLNDFDAPHSPAGRDLIREYVDACNKHGIVPFFYHTTLDWYNEDFENDFDAYLEYLKKSVEILCTNYGKIGGLWFDGNWSKPAADWKVGELYATIRKHQPEAMIINNTGLSARGDIGHPEVDSVTFEQGRPTPMDRTNMTKYVAAEMCYTLNGHWGCGYKDFNYKAPKELIECLCDCRKVGANLLLNIGPTAQGGIIPIQKEYLNIMGSWMEIFGEAVYKGKPYSISDNNRDFLLRGDDNTLYMFIYDLGTIGSENVIDQRRGYIPERAFTLCSDTVASISWMDDGKQLEFSQNGDDLKVVCTGYDYGCDYCVRVAKITLR